MTERPLVCGWDIGGVNTKVALVRSGRVLATCHEPFELQRAPDRLVPLLRELTARVGAPASGPHAVTMTAELSQMFRRKREGVCFVLEAIDAACPGAAVHVFAVDGRFVPPERARQDPLSVAASNWAATARWVARSHPDAVLVDVGTTTTDVIPIVNGRVAAAGLTDPDRLASGELVYTGAVRTPVEAIVDCVPFRGADAGVSAEAFATTGDVYLWRGELEPNAYTVPAPDGRPATREFAGERLARVICADREMLDESDLSALADAVAGRQRHRLARALSRVRGRHPSLRIAVVTGVGAFLGAAAVREAGMVAVYLSVESDMNADPQCAPAASVALLLDDVLYGEAVERELRTPTAHVPVRPTGDIRQVIKVGGGLLAGATTFDRVLRWIDAAHGSPFLVVPGGGPFADAVREADQRFHPGDTAAHWMAVLGMDQYAHLIAARLTHGALVFDPDEARAAIAAGRVPVLAPYRWLRTADPLPHNWDVTSDSIAAWIARALGAEHLLIVKPPGVSGPESVDRWFSQVAGPELRVTITDVDGLEDG